MVDLNSESLKDVCNNLYIHQVQSFDAILIKLAAYFQNCKKESNAYSGLWFL